MIAAALARPPAPGVRWTSPEQWHVTLRFLGGVADDELPALVAALEGVAGAHARTVATAGPRVERFGRSVLVVPVAGLDALATATVEATAAFGEAPDPRPFAGHLTLARGRDVRPYTGDAVSATWPVDEVTLVRSTTLPQGALYDVLARFPLA